MRLSLLTSLAPTSPLSLAILLGMAHLVCDFALQGDRMAQGKSPGHPSEVPWPWWMAAHGSMHGLAVALITGVPLLGLAEATAHGLIDWGKCLGRYSLSTDQGLHLLCKLLWLALLPLV